MKKMQFLPELVSFLKENGYIYTVRKYRYSLEDHRIQVDGVGICERARIDQASSRRDLEPYVYKSGFKTVDDWWKKIKEFNRGYVGPYYLYEITLEESKREEENI